MRKKIVICLICSVAAFILFFPFIRISYDDGGTVQYKALAYEIIHWNRLYSTADPVSGETDITIKEDIDFYIFPFNFRDNINDKVWDEERQKYVKGEGAHGGAVTRAPEYKISASTTGCEHEFVVSPDGLSSTCSKCGEQIWACVDWWYPIDDYSRQFIGVWVCESNGLTLVFADNATFSVTEYRTDYQGNLYSDPENESAGGYWRVNNDEICFFEQRKLTYAEGEVISGTAVLEGDSLKLTVDGKHIEFERRDDVPLDFREWEPDYNEVFCDAVLEFGISPEKTELKASETKDFYITVTTKLTSGSIVFWGSSTIYGGDVEIFDDNGNTISEDPLCYTCDFTRVELKAGKIITGSHHFTTAWDSTDTFKPGTYHIRVSWMGQQTVFRDAVVIK